MGQGHELKSLSRASVEVWCVPSTLETEEGSLGCGLRYSKHKNCSTEYQQQNVCEEH